MLLKKKRCIKFITYKIEIFSDDSDEENSDKENHGEESFDEED